VTKKAKQDKIELTVKTSWRSVVEPSPAWKTLMAKLFSKSNKKEATPNHAPVKDGDGKELDANE